jgi:tetratricopeptide (TPR) repeat protein
MLAQIFFDMGLTDRAAEKSQAGLERVDEILKLHASHPLSRDLLEKAFETKWNLYLAHGDVQQAIATCRALLDLVPDTSLADQAFLKTGQAYYDTQNPAEVARAIPVLKLVIDMEGAAGAPAASLLLARVYEWQAANAPQPNVSQAASALSIAQYMKTAELFPDSPEAAEALKEVVTYHYKRGDYPRAAELLERVCQDYRDQEWLHKMLLTWGVVQLKMNRGAEAIEKLRSVIEEYPESDSAQKAAELLKKLRGPSEPDAATSAPS